MTAPVQQPYQNSYTVGKGRLFFNQFAPGTTTPSTIGELFLGNCSALDFTVAKTTLEHFSSQGGIAVKDASVDVQFNTTGKLTTDNIVPSNLAMFFHGTAAALVQTAQTNIVEVANLQPGRWYQLGVSAALPQGLRDVVIDSMTTGSTPTAVPATDYVVDLARGRIFVETNAVAITGLVAVTITYNTVASSRQTVISQNQSIYGQLRFIADNPTGNDLDYFMPYVKMSADGSYALIGDKWQEMSFSLDILQLNDQTAPVYIDGQAA